MKKVIKLLEILLIFLVIINIFANCTGKCYGMSDVTENPGFWKPVEVDAGNLFAKKVGTIIEIIRVIGVLASIGTLTVIGIKFFLGSVEEKAHYKQTLVPWLVGAILVFAITTLPTIIYDVFNSKQIDSWSVSKHI